MRACIFCDRRTMQNFYIGDKAICSACLSDFKELLGVDRVSNDSADGDGQGDSQGSYVPKALEKFHSSAAPMSPEVTASLAAAPTAPPVKVVLPKGENSGTAGGGSIPVPAGLSSEVAQSPELEQDPFASVGSGQSRAPSASLKPVSPQSSGQPQGKANPLASLGRGGGSSAAARLLASGGNPAQPAPGAPSAQAPGQPQAKSNPLAALGRSGSSSAAARLVGGGQGAPSQNAPQQRPPQRPATGVAPQQRPPQRPATGVTPQQRPPQRPATGVAPQQRPPQRPATGVAPQQEPGGTVPAQSSQVPGQPPQGGTRPPAKPKGSGPDLTSLLKGS